VPAYSSAKYSRLFLPSPPKERNDLQFLQAAVNSVWRASVAENEPTAGGSSSSLSSLFWVHQQECPAPHTAFCLLNLSCVSAEESFDSSGNVLY